MSVQQRKVFRIEKYTTQAPVPCDMFEEELIEIDVPPPPAPTPAPAPVNAQTPDTGIPWADSHKEIMNTLKLLQEEFKTLKEDSEKTAQADDTDRIAPLSAKDIEEARRLRAELKDIYDAIEQTKVEILTIHQSGVNGMEISRVTDELGAIVGGTEKATETILEAAEAVDQSAADLAAMLKDESMQGLASDIQDGVIKIFESCNFQDLTGQRISKVVSAFRFIEERVMQMMDIWGGVDSFSEIETEIREDRKGDRALLNGPALEEDDNVASQDDIDALFD